MTYTATAKLYLKKQVRLQLLTSIKEKVEILQNEKGPEDEEGGYSRGGGERSAITEQFVLGSGQGTSKKNAKLVAAEKAVNMLLPEVLFDQDHMGALEANGQVNYDAKATEVFDKMEITDKRVVTYCERALVAKPYHCLKVRLFHLFVGEDWIVGGMPEECRITRKRTTMQTREYQRQGDPADDDHRALLSHGNSFAHFRG